MATITVTNQVASSALRGEVVKITLNSSDELAYLSSIAKGQPVTVVSSSNTGLVYSVDYNGNSFKVVPTMPTTNFSSSTKLGYLDAADTLSITV